MAKNKWPKLANPIALHHIIIDQYSCALCQKKNSRDSFILCWYPIKQNYVQKTSFQRMLRVCDNLTKTLKRRRLNIDLLSGIAYKRNPTLWIFCRPVRRPKYSNTNVELLFFKTLLSQIVNVFIFSSTMSAVWMQIH